MWYDVDNRASDSPFVEAIWLCQSDGGGSFISSASSNLEMVITKQENAINFTLRGPDTKASQAPIPADAEFLGITFKLGTFIPPLPASELVDGGVNLPEAASQSFWLHGSAWEFPTFENADTFVDRLVREGLLAHEPIVEAALQGQLPALSVRSIQRRFLRATGVTHKAMYQIKRAHYAMTLLQQGVSILDTVEQAGYYDQPHLTRSLKHLIGKTPAEILRGNQPE
jgi:AraC-like DNA-binding protein